LAPMVLAPGNPYAQRVAGDKATLLVAPRSASHALSYRIECFTRRFSSEGGHSRRSCARVVGGELTLLREGPAFNVSVIFNGIYDQQPTVVAFTAAAQAADEHGQRTRMAFPFKLLGPA